MIIAVKVSLYPSTTVTQLFINFVELFLDENQSFGLNIYQI